MASTHDVPGRLGTVTTTAATATEATMTTTSPSTTPGATSPADAPGAAHGAERAHAPGPVVGLILALLVGSTLAMTAFIWYRWVGVREPTTAVIIEGNAS